MILNKCDIEEIAHLLIKEGNIKDYQVKRKIIMKNFNIAIIGLGNIGAYLLNYCKKTTKIYQKK